MNASTPDFDPVDQAQNEYHYWLQNLIVSVNAMPIDKSTAIQSLVKARGTAQLVSDLAVEFMNEGGQVIIHAEQGTIRNASYEAVAQWLKRQMDALRRYERMATISMWPLRPIILEKHEQHVLKSKYKRLYPDYFVDNRHTLNHVGLTEDQMKQMLYERPNKPAISNFLDKPTLEACIVKVMAYYEDEIEEWLRGSEVRLSLPPDGDPPFDIGRPIGHILRAGRSNREEASKIMVIFVRDKRSPTGFWLKNALTED